MTTPYETYLATELADAGFQPGIVTPDNTDLGHWYLRTYRSTHCEVEVNEETGDARVSRLADDANDANGWPWTHTVTFTVDTPPNLVAAYAQLVDRHQPDAPAERLKDGTGIQVVNTYHRDGTFYRQVRYPGTIPAAHRYVAMLAGFLAPHQVQAKG